jgi:S-formylglutathione hydrolase FrmB
MAVFHGILKSRVILTEMPVALILPQDFGVRGPQPRRALYLLHGLGRGYDAWLNYTTVDAMARRYGLTVIMPEVRRNLYCDMVYGRKMFTYLTEELPALLEKTLRIEAAPENTFVMGQSLGGYGALKWAFTFPERFGAAAAFSAPLDLERGLAALTAEGALTEDEIRGHFGEGGRPGEGDSIFSPAGKLAGRVKVYQCCGSGDFLLENNRAANRLLAGRVNDYRYEEWEGGHDFTFFNQALERALAFCLGEGQ